MVPLSMAFAQALRRIFFSKCGVACCGVFAAVLFAGCESPDHDRLWVDTKVNGQPVRMCVDTGSTNSLLNRNLAEDLGLKFPGSANGESQTGEAAPDIFTDPASLSVWNTEGPTRFRVSDFPAYVHFNISGLVGWNQMQGRILQIDALKGEVRQLNQLPEDLSSWLRLRVLPRQKMLTLLCRRVRGRRDSSSSIRATRAGWGCRPNIGRNGAPPILPTPRHCIFLYARCSR